jgi:uncharacterized protein (TIGR02246 family)
MATLVAGPLAVAFGDEPNRQGEEEAIRKAVASYVEAFNRADADALAALWSPEAVYTNPISGIQVVGRTAIQAQFAGIFAESPGAKLEASTQSVQFISPAVAVEQGSAKLTEADQAPLESNYTAIYVKQNGQWLLDRVTEEDVVEVPSPYEHLKDLDWLVGRWMDQDDQATVVTECHWARNNSFLVRSFTVNVSDRIDMAGIQVVGWDPAAKQIRSWVFDSDGGFGQGTWTQKGNQWFVQQNGVLANGQLASEVNIITKIDDQTCTLQSVNRTVGGELLPNIDEVQVTKE